MRQTLALAEMQRAATIAPADSPRRDEADYICTGTNDQETLAQALSDGHSRLLLLAGNFNFAGRGA